MKIKDIKYTPIALLAALTALCLIGIPGDIRKKKPVDETKTPMTVEELPVECTGLLKNPCFACIIDFSLLNPNIDLSRENYLACGYTFKHISNGTSLGERDVFSCLGPPDISIIDIPNKPGFGVASNDPPCMFDVNRRPSTNTFHIDVPGEPGVEDCFSCHDSSAPLDI